MEKPPPKKERSVYFCSGILIAAVFLAFILLTPLGPFETWIPKDFHKGFYSLTKIDPSDDTCWYSFLRSTYYDRDIDFSNEVWLEDAGPGKEILRGYYHAGHLTHTGYAYAPIYGIGSSLLWAPFLSIGDRVARFYESHGYSVRAFPKVIPGYRYPEMISVAVGSIFYFFSGLLICFLLFRKYFSSTAALLAVLAIALCTELPYYAFIRNRMVHANEFFAAALAVFCWDRVWRGHNKWLDHLAMAAGFGLLALVRLNDVLFLILPLAMYAGRAIQSARKQHYTDAGREVARMGLLGAVVIFCLLPMFVALKIIFGGYTDIFLSTNYFDRILPDPTVSTGPGPITAQPLLISQLNPVFLLKNFSLLDAIFSSRVGILWCFPLIILGWIGLGYLCRIDRWRGSLFTGLYLLFFVWFHNLSGADYGYRYLIQTWVLLGFGLAALAAWFEKPGHKPYFRAIPWALMGILVLWNYLFLVQYKTIIPWNNPILIKQVFENLLYRNLPAHWFWRSTSIPGLCFSLGELHLRSHLDWLFLVITPLFTLFCLCLSVVIFIYLPRRYPENFKVFTITFFLQAVLIAALVMHFQNPPISPDKRFQRYLEQGIQLLYVPSDSVYRNRAGFNDLRFAYLLRPQEEKLRDFGRQSAMAFGKTYEQQGDLENALWFYKQAIPFLQRPEEIENLGELLRIIEGRMKGGGK